MRKRLEAKDTFVLDPGVKCTCGNHATHLLEMHLVDCCTPEAPTRTDFQCNACLTKLFVLTAQLVSDKDSFCSTCFLPFDSQCAIIVSLIPIAEGKV